MFSVSRFALGLAVVLTVGPDVYASDETREPPAKYRLEVDGKAYAIAEGEALKLTGTLTDPTVKLLVEPYREFAHGGVSFLYPRSFTFEADIQDADAKNWTLSGNNFKIMYFLVSKSLTSEEFADSMTEQFGKDNCNRSQVTIDLLGEKLAGTRLNVNLAGHKMAMDILRLPSEANTKLLVLQDNPDASGRATEEARDALGVLQKSLATN